MEFDGMNENATDSIVRNKSTHLSKLLILKWLSKASANGLNHLAEAQKLTKLLWLIIILCAYTCLSIHIALLTLYYMSYPTAYEYRLESVLVEMPDITICREGSFEIDANMKKRYLLNKKLWNKLFSYEKNIDKLRYAPHMFLRASTFSKRFAEKNSYQLKAYQIFCNFLGSSCYNEDFSLFIDTMFYKCYTYRPKNAHLTMNGKFLDIGFNSLKGMIADSSNIIVTVHERGTIPLIFKHGVTLLPGRHTNIQIESLKVSLSNLPDHRCHENATISLSDAGGHEAYKYTKEMCVFNELQEKVESECGCWSPVIRVMSSNNSKQDNCFAKVFDSEKDVPTASQSQEAKASLLRSPDLADSSSPLINNASWTTSSTDQITIEEITQFLSDWTPENNLNLSNEAMRGINKFIEKARIQFECHQRQLQRSSEYFIKSKCLKACQWTKLRTYVTSEEITMEKLLAIKKYIIKPTPQAPKPKLSAPIFEIESAPIRFKSKDEMAMSNTEDVLNWLSKMGEDGTGKRRRRQSSSNIAELEKLTLLSLSIAATPGDEIMEVQLYRISALLSEIGGVLGLWCGASVISLCELFQLIWLLFNATLLSIFSRRRPSMQT